MAGFNKNISVGLGPVTAVPTVHHSATLSTTPVQVTLCDLSLGQVAKVKISNLTAATNRLAWTLVTAGAAAPSVTATPGTGACGVILAVGQTEYFSIPAGFDMYIVGSAASTIVAVASYPV